jgi:coenzyme F420-reducing hydrogenase delta subunit
LGGSEIKPRIAIVPCKWHPLTAMENAAKDGLTYDARAVVAPVKCSGLVKVSYLLRLFAKGVEGVLVLGCQEEDCRYYNGSRRCGDIVKETREILELAGIPGERLGFELVSESGGKQVNKMIKAFLKQFRKVVKKEARRRQRSRSSKRGKGVA